MTTQSQVPADDDALVAAGKNERSRTLAKLYRQMAETAPCERCILEHDPESEYCPKAVWEQAARMAAQMIED